MKSLSCKEAVDFILKKEERKLSIGQRIQLWRHLAICNLCRIFSSQNSLINKHLARRKESEHHLSEAEKQKMIKDILDQKP